MNKIIKKIFGIDKIEEAISDAETRMHQAIDYTAAQQREAERAGQAALQAQEEERLAKLTPKEKANRLKEPWVAVLDTKVNPDNIRNGFFELDWNDLFVLQLRQAGYGSEGDLEEEIVDRWFRDIVSQMLDEEGMDANRGSGYINVVPIAKGKSQVS